MLKPLSLLLLLLTASSFTISPSTFTTYLTSLLPSPTVSDVNWPFKVLQSGTWNISSLSFNIPPSRGAHLRFTIKATAVQDTTFREVDIAYFLNDIFLHNEVDTHYHRDYKAGTAFEYTHDLMIPSFAPGGRYMLQFSYKNKDGKENGVWSMTYDLK